MVYLNAVIFAVLFLFCTILNNKIRTNERIGMLLGKNIEQNFKMIQTQITKKPRVIYSCRKRSRHKTKR